MFHHDARDYATAASEAAARGRVRMEEIIHKGIESAARVIEDIQARVVQDSVIRTAAARIEQAAGTWKLAAGDILAPGCVLRFSRSHPWGALFVRLYTGNWVR